MRYIGAMMMRMTRAVVAAAVLGASASHAQQAVPAPKPKPEVDAELRILSWFGEKTVLWTGKRPAAPDTGNREATAYVEQAGAMMPVKFKPNMYSAPFRYLGTRRFAVYRQVLRDGKPGHEVLAETMLPPGVGKYVIFVAGSATAPVLGVFPYGARTLPGRLCLFNSSARKMAMKIGGQRALLEPGGTQVYDISVFTDYQMPVEVLVGHDGGWIPGVSTRCAVRFTERAFGVVGYDEDARAASFTLLPTLHPEGK